MGIGYWRILCLLHRIPQLTFSSLFRHRASFQYSPVMLRLSPATRILNENCVLRQCYQHTVEVGPPSQCPAKINIDSPSITQADDPDIGGGSSPLVSICFLKISGAVINKMCIEMISRIDSHHFVTKCNIKESFLRERQSLPCGCLNAIQPHLITMVILINYKMNSRKSHLRTMLK